MVGIMKFYSSSFPLILAFHLNILVYYLFFSYFILFFGPCIAVFMGLLWLCGQELWQELYGLLEIKPKSALCKGYQLY